MFIFTRRSGVWPLSRFEFHAEIAVYDKKLPLFGRFESRDYFILAITAVMQWRSGSELILLRKLFDLYMTRPFTLAELVFPERLTLKNLACKEAPVDLSKAGTVGTPRLQVLAQIQDSGLKH